MTNRSGDQEREWHFFGHALDPLVRELLTLTDPWEAYRRANQLSALMTDSSPDGSFSLPHAGEVFVAWAELADLFDTGKTPIANAHATLRLAAERWLDRPDEPSASFIERWAAEASEAVGALYDRDGNWWRDPR